MRNQPATVCGSHGQRTDHDAVGTRFNNPLHIGAIATPPPVCTHKPVSALIRASGARV
jgi:hypothetical protein